MRCDEVREKLVDLLYEEIGAASGSSELRAHVDSCPKCRTELDELRAVRGLLGAWSDEAPLRPTAVPVRSAARAPVVPFGSGRAVRPFALLRWGAIAAAAAVAFLVLANAEITWNREGFSFRTHVR